jgi:hypothetical protein
MSYFPDNIPHKIAIITASTYICLKNISYREREREREREYVCSEKIINSDNNNKIIIIIIQFGF